MQPNVSPAPFNGPRNVIYGLHLGDHRYRYVGLTTQNIEKRLIQHTRQALSGTNTPVYHWIRKHNPNVVISVIEEVSKEILCDREIYWIAYLKSEGYPLLNLSVGGDGPLGVVRSEETRRKMSEATKGRRKSPEHIAGIRKGWETRSRIIKPETSIKLSKAGLGNLRAAGPHNNSYLTPEYRTILSESRKGKPNIGSHIRWHTNRNMSKPETCKFCKEESEKDV